jgi:elongation factor Ts
VAANPDVEFVSMDEVDPAYKEGELAAELQKEDLLSKPEKMRITIAEGRVNKRIGKKCLMNQEFIKDPTKSVESVVKEAVVQLKENIKVRRFTRFNLGEGIEKKVDDFAAEVAAQTGQA